VKVRWEEGMREYKNTASPALGEEKLGKPSILAIVPY